MNKENQRNIKLGERFLEDQSLSLILPNWSEFITQVQQIRETAKNLDKSKNRKYEREDYNNVISILGERGSGKSSVLLTLRNKLIEDNKKPENEDIFLDLIVPEMLEDTSDILGVILLNLKTFIDSKRIEIDNYYKLNARKEKMNGTFDSCMYKEKTKLDLLWEKVFSLYIYRKKDYKKVIEENFSGVTDYTEERKEALVSELELTFKLHELFQLFLEILNDKNKGEGLIFVCFDDVDLNPRRCNEVLNVILKYLNHSNIITFISGDILKFQEDMVGQLLLENESYRFLNEKFVEERKLIDSQKDLAYDFLKKIMPYSRRFNLDKLSNKAKMNFSISDNSDQELLSIKDLIDKFFKDTDSKPYEYYKNQEKGNSSKIYIYSVFQIFDDKPRGILNVYSYLYSNYNLFNNRELTTNRKEIYSYYKKLFSMIIETNSILRKYKDFLETLYTINPDIQNTVTIEIHHDRLQINLESKENKISKKEYIMILHFMYFIESLVKNGYFGIKGEKYSQHFNQILGAINSQKIIPETSNVLQIFALYSELSEVFDLNQMEFIYNKRIYFKKYSEIINRNFTDYEKRYSDDPYWIENFKSMSDNKERDVEIKNNILEDFRDFNFDLSILNNLKIYDENNLIEIYDDQLLINEFENDFDHESEKFEDYSLYFFFFRTLSNNINLEDNKKIIYDFQKKLHVISKIINKNKFRINLNLIKTYDAIQIKKSKINYIDLEIVIEELQIFKSYLQEELQFFLKLRSKYNEKLLINRIKEDDKRIKIYFPRINFKYSNEKSDEILQNYFSNVDSLHSKIDDKDYTEYSKDIVLDEDLLQIGHTTEIMKNLQYKMVIKDNINKPIPEATLTKSWNAFKQLSNINFHYLMVIAIDDLIEELETSQINIILYNIENKYNGFNLDGEKVMENKLEKNYEHLKDLFQSTIKNKLSNENKTQGIYELKNKLLAKFESLEKQYEIHEINIQQLNLLISKLQDENLIAELKDIQRKLLKNGRVNSILFDTILKRMNAYFDKNSQNSFAFIELKSLSENLLNIKHVRDISAEITRIKNSAKERVYQMQLEQLINATAYLYNMQLDNESFGQKL